LRRAASLYERVSNKPAAEGVQSLLDDPAFLAAHRQMLPPPRRPGLDPLNVPMLTGAAKLAEASCLDTVWPTLDTAERAAVLSDETALRQLLELHRANPLTASAPARLAG
jgi:membrane glycosyltransferase